MVCRYLCSLNSQRFSDTAPSHSQLSSRGNFQGAAGWSNGYAHMGLNSLSRNYQGEVWLGEGIFKYKVCYYFGMSIDFERDNFLVRDENTLGCLLIYRKPGGAQLNPPEDKIACPLIR
jgi:hypothetical protein